MDLSSVGSCDTRTYVDGNELSGTFILSFEGKNTNPIAFDATAMDVQTELRSLSTISNDLKVSRSEPDFAKGFVWTVTFNGNPGDVAMLGFSSSLSGAGHDIVVQEILKGNEIGGTFTLGGSNGEITNSISAMDATAEDVKNELEVFCGAVDVSKNVFSVDLVEYVVTFLMRT